MADGIESAMAPMTGDQGVMGYNANMMCQILMKLGALEAKIDSIIKDEEDDDMMEGEPADGDDKSGPELSTNPALYSPQLEFDLPPLF